MIQPGGKSSYPSTSNKASWEDKMYSFEGRKRIFGWEEGKRFPRLASSSALFLPFAYRPHSRERAGQGRARRRLASQTHKFGACFLGRQYRSRGRKRGENRSGFRAFFAMNEVGGKRTHREGTNDIIRPFSMRGKWIRGQKCPFFRRKKGPTNAFSDQK